LDKEVQKLVEHDKFTETVGHSVEYVQSHRKQLVRQVGFAAVAIVAVGGFWSYRNQQATARQADLAAALRNKDAVVGPGTPNDPRPSYPTKEAKDLALTKGFENVISNYGGSDEASVAHLQLGNIAADAGKLDEAGKHYKTAADKGSSGVASVAKLALAQVYFSTGKAPEGESLLRGLIASPTVLVSKEQATLVLARALIPSKPEEARKLIEPYKADKRQTIARNAEILLGELPAKK
jgi:predicted negative regulator of RcsB-dependent stress response